MHHAGTESADELSAPWFTWRLPVDYSRRTLLCYALFDIRPEHRRTINAVLADLAFNNWPLGGWIAFITILSKEPC